MAEATPQHRVVARLTTLLGAGGAIALLSMTLAVCLDVVLRNVAGSALTGTTELVSHWFMVGIVFLALGGLQARHLNITFDLTRGHLPARVEAALDFLAAILMVIAALGLVWYSSGEAYTATVRGESIELPGFVLPIWPPRWLVPIGFAVAGFTALLQSFDALKTVVRGANEPG